MPYELKALADEMLASGSTRWKRCWAFSYLISCLGLHPTSGSSQTFTSLPAALASHRHCFLLLTPPALRAVFCGPATRRKCPA